MMFSDMCNVMLRRFVFVLLLVLWLRCLLRLMLMVLRSGVVCGCVRVARWCMLLSVVVCCLTWSCCFLYGLCVLIGERCCLLVVVSVLLRVAGCCWRLRVVRGCWSLLVVILGC